MFSFVSQLCTIVVSELLLCANNNHVTFQIYHIDWQPYISAFSFVSLPQNEMFSVEFHPC